jgi:hypothetical protein
MTVRQTGRDSREGRGVKEKSQETQSSRQTKMTEEDKRHRSRHGGSLQGKKSIWNVQGMMMKAQHDGKGTERGEERFCAKIRDPGVYGSLLAYMQTVWAVNNATAWCLSPDYDSIFHDAI